MGKKIAIETVVHLDLAAIDEEDLMDEAERRGLAVDDEWAGLSEYSSAELLEELEGRTDADWQAMGALELINALERMGCPESILTQLEHWDREPIVDKDTLTAWLALCSQPT